MTHELYEPFKPYIKPYTSYKSPKLPFNFPSCSEDRLTLGVLGACMQPSCTTSVQWATAPPAQGLRGQPQQHSKTTTRQRQQQQRATNETTQRRGNHPHGRVSHANSYILTSEAGANWRRADTRTAAKGAWNEERTRGLKARPQTRRGRRGPQPQPKGLDPERKESPGPKERPLEGEERREDRPARDIQTVIITIIVARIVSNNRNKNYKSILQCTMSC